MEQLCICLALVGVNKNKVSLILGTCFGGLGLAGAYQATEQPEEPILALVNAGLLSSTQIIRNIKDVRTRVVSLERFDCILTFLFSYSLFVDSP